MLVRIDDSESQLNKRQFASLANTATNAYFTIFLHRIIKHTINHCERSHIMIDTLSKKSIIKKLCSVGTIAVRCLSEFTYLGSQKDCVSLQIQYKNNMSDKKIILLAFGVTFVAIMTYVICFWGTGISKNTTDWGAFGNYLAVGVSVFSVALIYITYREQRKTNEIARNEHHITTMLNTLNVLSEKNQSKIETTYFNILEHFKVPFYDLSEYEYEKIVKVCRFYYSLALGEKDDSIKLNYYFQYLNLCIDNIIHNKTLSKEQIQLQITELSCVLTEDSRLLFFFWLLSSDSKVLVLYYKYGLFIISDEASPLLKDIVSYICSGKRPTKRQTRNFNEDVILDDYTKEQFSDTYSRMFK